MLSIINFPQKVKGDDKIVQHKTTDDLRQELMSAPNLDRYINSNREQFSDRSVADLLTELYKKHPISKAALARRAGMSEVYLHQVFSGRRKPSRDRILCLCVGMGATLEETQVLLKQASYAQLYPKNRRDVIISFGLLHGANLYLINDKLFAENEKTLC